MKLYDLIPEAKDFGIENSEVTSVTDNTKNIQDGCVFVCIKGNSFDGHSFAQTASEKGACAVITGHRIGVPNEITVEDTRRFYGELCAAWFDHPEKKLKIIGVTGTNGKTSMTKIIKELLTSLGHKTGLIGTIQNEIGKEIIKTENTTPMAFDFMSILNDMVKKECEYVVMEVSSFGLAQNRIGTVHFDVGVFTNLTQDHLDYHKTMENYYQAKKLMFDVCDKALINTDDEYGKRLFSEIQSEKYSYGFSDDCDFRAENIKLTSGRIKYDLIFENTAEQTEINMTGKFNVANSLGAIASCILEGMDKGSVFSVLNCIHGVKGRCEVIPSERNFTVICDYAHTPDALVNILTSLREVTDGRLICLFGCGGNRDKAKRPMMAKASSEYADKLIITSDNPRDEDPSDIINEIISGILDGTEYEVIEDRKEAIFHAVQSAEDGDVIVLAGKGHEDYQVLKNNQHIHFDEREIVRMALDQIRQ